MSSGWCHRNSIGNARATSTNPTTRMLRDENGDARRYPNMSANGTQTPYTRSQRGRYSSLNIGANSRIDSQVIINHFPDGELPADSPERRPARPSQLIRRGQHTRQDSRSLTPVARFKQPAGLVRHHNSFHTP